MAQGNGKGLNALSVQQGIGAQLGQGGYKHIDQAGTDNTGGGGGGSHGCTASGAGGSGIVIIRYKFQ